MSHTHPFTQSAARFFVPPARGWWFRAWPTLVSTLVLWRERRRTRQHLDRLDDRALADVGLTRAQQRSECAKSFWQL
ncbi:MAG TPA: DUF1127 domain-containing protein [Reyranella sp.]|nr:DUF1127 domain-containing protein [Reyranella sp.]